MLSFFHHNRSQIHPTDGLPAGDIEKNQIQPVVARVHLSRHGNIPGIAHDFSGLPLIGGIAAAHRTAQPVGSLLVVSIKQRYIRASSAHRIVGEMSVKRRRIVLLAAKGPNQVQDSA